MGEDKKSSNMKTEQVVFIVSRTQDAFVTSQKNLFKRNLQGEKQMIKLLMALGLLLPLSSQAKTFMIDTKGQNSSQKFQLKPATTEIANSLGQFDPPKPIRYADAHVVIIKIEVTQNQDGSWDVVHTPVCNLNAKNVPVFDLRNTPGVGPVEVNPLECTIIDSSGPVTITTYSILTLSQPIVTSSPEKWMSSTLFRSGSKSMFLNSTTQGTADIGAKSFLSQISEPRVEIQSTNLPSSNKTFYSANIEISDPLANE